MGDVQTEAFYHRIEGVCLRCLNDLLQRQKIWFQATKLLIDYLVSAAIAFGIPDIERDDSNTHDYPSGWCYSNACRPDKFPQRGC